MDKKYMKMHANTIGDMFFKRHQTNATKKKLHVFGASKSIIETSRLRRWYTTTTFQVDLDTWTLTANPKQIETWKPWWLDAKSAYFLGQNADV